MTLQPAYGRDYKSAKAVKEDWAAGKDFLITDQTGDSRQATGAACDYLFINNADASKVEGSIMVRYARNTKIVQVK